MLVNDLVTWILNRGVTQDDIDQIAESLGLSPEVTDVDGFSRTVIYKSGAIRTACDHDILMRYTSGPQPSIRVARVIGIIPKTNHVFIWFATTLRPAFTSRKKLSRILRNLLDDIQKAEARAASTDIASSRDVLASLCKNTEGIHHQ